MTALASKNSVSKWEVQVKMLITKVPTYKWEGFRHKAIYIMLIMFIPVESGTSYSFPTHSPSTSTTPSFENPLLIIHEGQVVTVCMTSDNRSCKPNFQKRLVDPESQVVIVTGFRTIDPVVSVRRLASKLILRAKLSL